MAAYLFKKAVVYVGVAGFTPGAGDALRTEEVTLNFASGEANRRPTGGAAMGTNKTFIGGLEGSITVKVPLKGSGTAGTAPDIDTLLESCHMVGVNSPATSETYTPSNAVPTLYDIYVQVPEIAGGTAYEVVLTGCVGNLTLEGERNGPVFAVCELKGVFQEPTNETVLDATGLDTEVAQNFKGTSVTLHSYAGLIIEGFSFDMGQELVMRPSMAADDGFVSAIGISRAPSGTLNPEIPAISDFDPYTVMTAETLAALAFGAIGSVAGNIVTISMPKCQIVGVNLVERAGMLVGDLALDFHETTTATGGGADDISIVFT